MATKTYQLYCDLCHWKRITDGSNVKDLREIKMSNIQKNLPKLDEETHHLAHGEIQNQPKRFRCPKCGRQIIPRQIDNPQSKIDEQHKMEERMERRREQEDKLEQDRLNADKEISE